MPKEIGPHEGRELGLMLAGEKPLAMFSDIVPSSYEWPDALFEPYVSSGVLLKRDSSRDLASPPFTTPDTYVPSATVASVVGLTEPLAFHFSKPVM